MEYIRSLFVASLFTVVGAVDLSAQEFRIETEVVRGDDPTPISENLTIFDDNLIVDFMLRPDKTRFPTEVVAFVVSEKRFVLLDTTRKVKAEIIESELLKMLAALQSAPFIDEDNRFLFHPQFEETLDPVTGVLELRSPRLIYRVRGERPPREMVLHVYFEFIDQFARLNATDPRRMPPFARLILNQAIKKHGMIPNEIELTLYPHAENEEEPVRLRTRHVTMWDLSRTDRERIESAKRYWTEFQPVTLKEYRRLAGSVEASVAEKTGEAEASR